MKFCSNCGNLMRIGKDETGKILICKNCNLKEKLEEEVSFTQQINEEKTATVIPENQEAEFPTTKVLCPKCQQEREAFWTMQQTRAADEPPTRFYRCKTCNYTWREYA